MVEKKGNTKSEAAMREERVLEFWKENKIFEKSLKQSEGKKEFIFYEGPPTANGAPGIHHLEARAFKDAIPRYKTMRGYHVRRKGGWDTHGLAVEIQAEKMLGLNSKKAIEEYGIAKFNQKCKESVWEYLDVWNKFTTRIGYWVDQENPYVTYHNDYIESVWNIVQKINEQNLLYKDYKVVPWCPRCGTALSSHELAQGYEDVKDLSVTVKFKITTPMQQDSAALPASGLRHGQNSAASVTQFILAWTTTPWTLPGNVALAVGKDIEYVKIKMGGEILTLAKERLSIIAEPYEIIDEVKGKDLIGLEYEPLFPYLQEQIKQKGESTDKMFKVYGADFVTTGDGTGIVHTAVMYGQDDFVLGTEIGLPKHHLVGLDGRFLSGTEFLEGRFVKEKDENGKPTLDVDIIKYLTDKNLFFSKENYQHSYPHCWRCHTALIYYARDSWYIKMSSPLIKKQLIDENRKINWEPAHTRDGRFGEWLREIKDWAISRERYWGTPLPVWVNKDQETLIVGSIDELKKYSRKSGNEYFVMRHGEADNIILDVVTSNEPQYDKYHLTENGKKEVLISARALKGKKIDLIISSPLIRTRETAEIAAKEMGFSEKDIVYDDLLREINTGDFHNKKNKEYHAFFSSTEEKFKKTPPNGENLTDLKRRVMEFLYEAEKKYQGKKILIVSHEYAIWMMSTGTFGWSDKKSAEEKKQGRDFIKTGEVANLPFAPLPHNENFDIDLHRPYVDDFFLEKDGKKYKRTNEVMDVWFDSGAMPFAQDHYPFDPSSIVAKNSTDYGAGNKKLQQILYPADFICEAIDQTRGWFYTLHAVGILMGRGLAFKNVICLGHLLDAKGKKMSKSVGNVVDPWEAMDKYGVDTLRLWMYSVNQPGESKNFDEKTVALLYSQVFGLLYNVLAFYELYPIPEQARYGAGRDVRSSKNVLDIWILARLDELIKLMTENLDGYRLLEPTRAIRDFVGDLSTWYLRRSRERIKSSFAEGYGGTQDGNDAKKTLYFVLKTLAKLLAPFAPLAAEDIWLKLRNENDAESVHLTEWPKKSFKLFSFGEPKILRDMEVVRNIVSLGLEARQKAGIKVRQPLNRLEIIARKLSEQYLNIIKDELNIKNIDYVLKIKIGLQKVDLDTVITPELKAEGEYREFMRELQDMRKKMGLNPGDKMVLPIEMIYKKYKIMPNLQEHMLRVAAVASLICDNLPEPINKEEIITACLLHDMGNIIKFRLDSLPKFLEPEGVEYWQKVQDEYIKKYGEDEHEATIQIMKDIGVSERVIFLVEQLKFSLFCQHRDNNEINTQITIYADNRVDPHGIVSYEGRFVEAAKRYKDRPGFLTYPERDRLIACGKDIEKQIFAKCKIRPEDINNETVKPIIAELKNFVIPG